MCKLCNTDRKPIKYSKKLSSIIVKEYIGEYPCIYCSNKIQKSTEVRKTIDIDTCIIRNLYLAYRPFSAKVLKSKKSYYTKKHTLGVRVSTNINTGFTIYESIGTIGTTWVNISSHNSFLDALKAKIDFMIKHKQTKGLTRLKNKLKELQNEN